MPGIIAGCLLVMLPVMGLFYVSDLMGGAKNLLIGNVIKSQFLKHSRLAVRLRHQHYADGGDGSDAAGLLARVAAAE